jgi:hypothetical protein
MNVEELLNEMIDVVAQRAADIVIELLPSVEPAWPSWMDVSTAARYLSISEDRVWKLKRRGVIPYSQEAKGCRCFFSKHNLDDWMKAQQCD